MRKNSDVNTVDTKFGEFSIVDQSDNEINIYTRVWLYIECGTDQYKISIFYTGVLSLESGLVVYVSQKSNNMDAKEKASSLIMGLRRFLIKFLDLLIKLVISVVYFVPFMVVCLIAYLRNRKRGQGIESKKEQWPKDS